MEEPHPEKGWLFAKNPLVDVIIFGVSSFSTCFLRPPNLGVMNGGCLRCFHRRGRWMES